MFFTYYERMGFRFPLIFAQVFICLFLASLFGTSLPALAAEADRSLPLESKTLPYAPQMNEVAGILAGENAIDSVQSIGAGALSSSAQKWLNQFGTARIQLQMDHGGHWSRSSGDLLIPLYDDQRSLLFFQGGMRKPDNRRTANLGFGVRSFWVSGWMYGGNVFFDEDFTGHNRRVGIGGEAWSNFIRMAGNVYVGRSGWHSSRDFDSSWQEKPADGYDFRVEGWLPAYPQLGAKLNWEQYYGSQVALFSREHLQRNPYAVTTGVNYTPVPLVAFDVNLKQGKSGYNDTQLAFSVHWNFGHGWRWQLDPANVHALRTLTGSRYELVDRNNEIVMQYRKNPALELAQLRLTVITDNSPADGTTRNILQAQATTKQGRPVPHVHLNWEVPAESGIALTGETLTDDNGMASATLTSRQARVIPVTVHSGNIAATEQSHFMMVAVSHIALEVKRNNAAADGKDTDVVVATLTDSNGHPVPGQKVAWDIPDNVRRQGGEKISDTAGHITLSLSSVTAVEVMLKATSGGQSTETSVAFVGDAASAKISALVITSDGSPADGKTPNTALVTVSDASGNPLVGQTVAFKADKPTVHTGASAVTDSRGKTTVNYTDTTAESLVLSASLANGNRAAASSLFVPDTSSARLKSFTVTTGAKASGVDTNTAIAIVTDAQDNLLSDTAVTFTVTGGANLSAAMVTTDSSGKAKITLTDALAETVQVTARLATGNSLTKESSFLTDLSNASFSVKSTAGAIADGTAKNTATVILKESNGKPIPGQSVALTISGSAQLSVDSGTTDDSGQLTVTFTDINAEISTLTATLSNGRQATVQSSFIIFSVSALNASTTGVSAGGIAALTLAAKVKDGAGFIVANTPVIFSTSGSARLSGITAATDRNGVAQVTLTDKVAETVTVVAKAQRSANDMGKSKTVTFTAVKFVSITANGHNFSLSDGFPTTGFSQAAFKLTTEGADTDYTWASSQSGAVSVSSDGLVTFMSKPSGSVSVSATPKEGGSPAVFTFTLNHWFSHGPSAATGLTWKNAGKFCSDRSGALAPVILLSRTSTGARGVGALWDEWGDLTQYSNAGYAFGSYWTADSSVTAGHTVYQTVTLTGGNTHLSQIGSNLAGVVCMD